MTPLAQRLIRMPRQQLLRATDAERDLACEPEVTAPLNPEKREDVINEAAREAARAVLERKGNFGFASLAAAFVKLFDDIHCFECTEIIGAAAELYSKNRHQASWPPATLLFLPAPTTWIEWRTQPTATAAVEIAKEHQYDRTGVLLTDEATICVYATPAGGVLLSRCVFGPHPEAVQKVNILLALINSPRALFRKQHMPHAGLQRQIARERGMVGKFPLHAYTELKLPIGPSKIDLDREHIAGLSGHRPLHFVRAHLRPYRDEIIHVAAHWRGDPALGIKQTRYRLTNPQVAA